MLKLPPKKPSEVWHCSLDISKWVVSGVPFVSAQSVNVVGSIVVADVTLTNENTVTFTVSGGTVNSRNSFEITVTFSDGQVFSEPFSCFVH